MHYVLLQGSPNQINLEKKSSNIILLLLTKITVAYLYNHLVNDGTQFE